MNIIIDGLKIKSEQDIHNYLSEAMSFPDYYGNNLDALWDMLSEVDEPVKIKLLNKNMLIENTSEKFINGLISVFEDAVDDNDNISFEIL